MRAICDCGSEMYLDEHEPDQNMYVATFKCDDCNSEAAVIFLEGGYHDRPQD